MEPLRRLILVLGTVLLAAEAHAELPFQSGETIRVEVYGRPDLEAERVIDESGRIALPLVGRVLAKGTTAEALEGVISERLREQDLDTTASVTVSAVHRLDIYLDGAVANPGAYPWRAGLTVAQAIAMAGGRSLVPDEQLGLSLSALKTVEYLDALERRIDGLRIMEARMTGEARLVAERFGTEVEEVGPSEGPAEAFFVLPPDLANLPALADLVATEHDLLVQGAARYDADHRSLLTQRDAVEERLTLLESRRENLARTSTLIEERLETLRGLSERGLAIATDVLEIQRASAETAGSQIDVAASIADAKVALEERNLQIATYAISLQRALATDIAGVRAELADNRVRLATARQAGGLASGFLGEVADPSAATPAGGTGEIMIRRLPPDSLPIPAGAGTELQPGDTVQVPSPVVAEN